MSQVNFNPSQPTLPQVIPPAPTGMSTVAKLVIALATVFFATFIAVVISRWNRPPPSQDGKEGEVTPPDEALEIQKILVTFFGNVSSGLRCDYGQIYAKFSESGPISAQDIQDVRDLIRKLQTPVETKEQRQEIREGQDEAFKASLKADQAKDLQKKTEAEMKVKLERMKVELENLNGGIDRETANLVERQESLECLSRCWGNIVILVRHKSIGEESFADQFPNFKKRFNIPSGLDETIPKDLFLDRVEAFNANYSEEAFQTQRTELGQKYERYTTAIGSIKDRLAWVRLKALYRSLGEDDFRAALTTSNLHKIFDGEKIDIS